MVEIVGVSTTMTALAVADFKKPEATTSSQGADLT